MIIAFKGFFLILILLGSFSFAYLFFTRKKLKKIASERLIHQTLSVKDVQQGIRSIKDIKVLGKEKEFLEYFKLHINNFCKMKGKAFFIQNIPKFNLELIMVTVLIISISFALNLNYEIGNIIVIVGMFAAASFKILPGVNRMMNSFVAMRYGYVSLEEIYQDLQTETKKINYVKNNIGSKLPFKNFIKFKNIYYSYPENKKIILNNINLEIRANTTIGLLGESGSGKTTFIDLLIGILNTVKGEIKVDEKDILSNLREWQNNIGYIPQFIYLIDDTIKKNIAFGLNEEIIDIGKMENALEVSQMKNFVETLPKKIETKVGEFGVRLSGGQRQRIGIARSLYNNPNLLVMDEATNSLDEETEKKIMNSIYLMKGKKTILISSHKKSILDKCDIILKFESGKVTPIKNK
jgi:ABC-type multidrug transport system fused ATPase/permease subunit